MTLRKIIFWLHLIAGVVAGVIVLIMSVTGVLIAYERQLTPLADGHRVKAQGWRPLPVETLLAKVREVETNGFPSITLRADPGAPAAFSYGRERTVFVNPYTGEILGEGAKKSRAFFRTMINWHRWLGTNEAGRAVGKGITGACNLAFLFLVCSGFYLWWPRNWSWASLKGIVWFGRGLSGKARDWNWHNVIGVWCALPLFFIVLTGVMISYPWATNLLYRITGSELPQQPQRSPTVPTGSEKAAVSPKQGTTAPRESSTQAEIQTAGLNKAWEVAEGKVSGWNYITLRFPPKPGGPLTFTIDRGNGARPDLRATLTVDAATGEEVRWQPYSTQSAGQKARSWGRFIHTGEAGGLVGQTIAGVASAGGAVLVWTGLSLAWRRFRARKKNGK